MSDRPKLGLRSASGLVVVYTTTGIFNFAQGAIGMFMAYVYWELTVNHGVPTVIARPGKPREKAWRTLPVGVRTMPRS